MENRKPSQSITGEDLRFRIETECETDGRWIAEITDMPGVMVYGSTEREAKANAYVLALRVLADRIEKSHQVPDSVNLVFA